MQAHAFETAVGTEARRALPDPFWPELPWALAVPARGSYLLFPTPPSGGNVEDWPRRLLNVIAALVLIVITTPIMLAVAVLVAMTSRGPILYSQLRVGMDRRRPRSPGRAGRRIQDRGGRLFRIYKFRTMYQGSDARGQVWAAKDDPRVTAAGRFLRSTRLDELPQLFNVLKGDMNLVGPRPEQPDIFSRLRGELPGYVLRQQVRPGITGLAQVSQSYDQDLTDVRSKLRFDLEYVRDSSPAADMRIMLRTFPVMLGRTHGW